jgi:hypothetical protein
MQRRASRAGYTGASFFDCIEEYFYIRRNNQGRVNGK